MKALITGGAGFIGSYLAENLLKASNEVVVVDNLSTGSLDNIDGLRAHPDFEFIEGDICDKQIIKPLIKDCDVVFHLAAAVGVRLIAEDPVHTIETNIGGTELVLNFAGEFNKKVMIASTSEVYGKNEAVPFSEDDDIVLGSTNLSRWSYACSKAIDEFLALAFYRQYKLEIVISRFFNTIGPRQTGQYGMVVPRFVRSALRNEPLIIYGTGKQTRCFSYVGDVVEAVAALVDSPRAFGRVFNIGSQEEISIIELADKIIEMTDSQSTKEFVPIEVAYGMPIEDMMRRVPNLQRIEKVIGWKPKTSLETMLKMIIESEKKR